MNGSRPRVAVVGAGPAGFYTAEAVLSWPERRAEVDLFERLPAPFGLVRYGVAPDHQKIKRVADTYERIAGRTGFRLLANVHVGRDVRHAELLEHYDQVVYAVGCAESRALGIPGENLAGAHGATDFVHWYNGHPDQADRSVSLDTERAVVVGIGDVAMDVARILLADPTSLATTDIAAHALDVLRASRVREVVMLARRGPAEAAFAARQLRDLARLDDVEVAIEPPDVATEPHAPAPDTDCHARLAVLAELAATSGTGTARTATTEGRRRLRIEFQRSPVALLGAERVTGVRIETNELVLGRDGTRRARGTGRLHDLEAGLVILAIGYRGVPIEGVPFDARTGHVPNVDGRVTSDDRDRHLLPRTYVAGWIKRGPSGLVGTNKACAQRTAEHMLEDLEANAHRGRPVQPRNAIDALLARRGVRVVTLDDWRRLDAHERALGRARGKVREKLVHRRDILAVLDAPADAQPARGPGLGAGGERPAP